MGETWAKDLYLDVDYQLLLTFGSVNQISVVYNRGADLMNLEWSYTSKEPETSGKERMCSQRAQRALAPINRRN